MGETEDRSIPIPRVANTEPPDDGKETLVRVPQNPAPSLSSFDASSGQSNSIDSLPPNSVPSLVDPLDNEAQTVSRPRVEPPISVTNMPVLSRKRRPALVPEPPRGRKARMTPTAIVVVCLLAAVVWMVGLELVITFWK